VDDKSEKGSNLPGDTGRGILMLKTLRSAKRDERGESEPDSFLGIGGSGLKGRRNHDSGEFLGAS